MFRLPKGWMMVSVFGQGVLLALALVGLLRITSWLSGTELSERVAGNVFLIGSLGLGSLFVFLYTRSLRRAASDGPTPPMLEMKD